MAVQRLLGTKRCLTLVGGLLLTTALVAPAMAQIEEVTVTAQKKAEDIQTVPISITAFTSQDLAAHQITQFKDLVFSTPNVSYTKSNFTGSNFQIRGIGITAVGNDSESGVAVHFDDVFLSAPLLAESTFYDLDRIEVLRGPQSTLYGRGATGGTINVITAKPNVDEFHAAGEFSYGNYNAKDLKGMVNVPIVQGQLGLRIAGEWQQHDGYVTNTANGSSIDGRDQFSVRGSLRWTPTDRTTIDLVGSVSRESDDRMRSQKQLCTTDPTGVLGCLPGSAGTGVINLNSTLATIASSKQALGGLGQVLGQAAFGPATAAGMGLTPGTPAYNAVVAATATTFRGLFSNMGLFDLSAAPVLPAPLSVLNPPDLRKVNTDFTPRYKAQDNFIGINAKQNLTDWLDVTFVGGYDRDSNWSQESYNNVGGQPFDPLTLATAEGTFLGTLAATFGPGYAAHYAPYFSTVPGSLPVSGIGHNGITGGNIGSYSNKVTASDQSDGTSNELSGELRFNTNFTGPVNFMLAGYFLQTRTHADYDVVANTFDYPFIVAGAFLGALDELGGAVPPGYCFTSGCINPGFYHNDGTLNKLSSRAVFGEAYWNILPDTLKLTLGGRYTDDQKFQQGRIYIFPGPVPIGTSSEESAASMLVANGLADFDASAPGAQLYQFNRVGYKKTTGRAVLDWTPKTDFTDATLVYASYAKGYKAGGFNPGIQPGLAVPATYGPESIDAFEVGTKNTLLDGTLQANGDVWYYDYKGLQVSAIIANTSVNQNIDAKLYGVEGELLWVPSDAWQFNLNFGHTHSAIGNSALVDQRNPTAGRTDAILIKGATLGSSIGQNCILYMLPGQTLTPGDNPLFQFLIPSLYFDPPGGSSSLAGVGVAHANFGDCGKAVPEANMNLLGYSYTDPTGGGGRSDGVPVSMKGNELQNTPQYTVSIGGQYTLPVDGGYSLVARADYYWQSSMWGRIFNTGADKIKAWDVANAQLTLNSPDQMWYVQAYVKNIFDKDNITGEYLTSATSGLYTNAFLGDPRTYGVAVGVRF